MLKFKNPEQLNRHQLKEIFLAGSTDEICSALVAMAFYDEDWKWSQDQCLRFLEHPEWEIRAVAATCLGHIARIHSRLDKELVEQLLKKHMSDEKIAGYIDNALDDINWFIPL